VLLAGDMPTGKELVPDFYRERSWEKRNGCGIQGQRPGRDAPMVSMGATLKAGTASR
jgi:hypothetical protein